MDGEGAVCRDSLICPARFVETVDEPGRYSDGGGPYPQVSASRTQTVYPNEVSVIALAHKIPSKVEAPTGAEIYSKSGAR
jgi:hypothetical protein